MLDLGLYLQELFEGLVTWVWERYGRLAGALFAFVLLAALVSAVIGAITLWHHRR